MRQVATNLLLFSLLRLSGWREKRTRERERERERDREIERDRQTDRQTERQRDRKTEREREREAHQGGLTSKASSFPLRIETVTLEPIGPISVPANCVRTCICASVGVHVCELFGTKKDTRKKFMHIHNKNTHNEINGRE